MKSKQQVFDQVVQHLYKQNKQSVLDDGTCAYRGKNGLMCAVGCLIPDEMYTPEMEGKYVYGLVRQNLPIPQEVVEYRGLLADMQELHDSPNYLYEGYVGIVDKLHEIAIDNDVVFNDPGNVA